LIDMTLLIMRIILIALMFLFLFAIMKTGIGQVRGQRRQSKNWTVSVERGPKELRGVKITVRGPVIIGRSPGSDIVIGAEYVSGRHARFTIMGQNLFIEDLGSTNGTAVNGQRISEPTVLKSGDVVNVGDVAIRVRYA
jgi:pSer/pThr/pTyr-binding forkhead associated (FHA) protein